MSTNEEHLMNVKTIMDFCSNMWEQLEKHKGSKDAIGHWNLVQVKKLFLQELRDRIAIIENSPYTDEINKQSLHIANFCYFLWCKTNDG